MKKQILTLAFALIATVPAFAADYVILSMGKDGATGQALPDSSGPVNASAIANVVSQETLDGQDFGIEAKEDGFSLMFDEARTKVLSKVVVGKSTMGLDSVDIAISGLAAQSLYDLLTVLPVDGVKSVANIKCMLSQPLPVYSCALKNVQFFSISN